MGKRSAIVFLFFVGLSCLIAQVPPEELLFAIKAPAAGGESSCNTLQEEMYRAADGGVLNFGWADTGTYWATQFQCSNTSSRCSVSVMLGKLGTPSNFVVSVWNSMGTNGTMPTNQIGYSTNINSAAVSNVGSNWFTVPVTASITNSIYYYVVVKTIGYDTSGNHYFKLPYNYTWPYTPPSTLYNSVDGVTWTWPGNSSSFYVRLYSQ